ncbi:MAG: D-alanyl-D-alanine carboxypeptidase family protein [Bacillota bacterium]
MLNYKKLVSGLNCVLFIFFVFIFMIFGFSNISLAKEPDFDISAKSALLMEVETGEIVYEKNPHQEMPPASMTKIMTLLLVMEALEKNEISLEDEIVTSENAAHMGGSQIWLEPGERMTLEEMVRAIAVVSANDSCLAVAEHIAGTEDNFIKKMNEKAEELGMENTYYYNTNGLPTGSSEIQGTYSSAYDLAIVSRELLKYPQVLEWTSIWTDQLRDGESELTNTNRLVRHYPGADGLKTGYTSEAGHGVSATARRGDLRFIAVIMGAERSDTRFEEAEKLLNYGFSSFSVKKVAAKDEVISRIEIANARETEMEVITPREVAIPIRRGSDQELKTRIKIDEKIEAPLEKGARIGLLEIYKDDELIEEIELVSARKAESVSFFVWMFRLFIQMLKSIVGILG